MGIRAAAWVLGIGIGVAATSSLVSFADAALDFLVFFGCGASTATGMAASMKDN